MSDLMKLDIVTPEGVAYTADVDMVTMPAVDGQIGVLPRHMPLLTRITPGEILIRTSAGAEDALAVGDGLVIVSADHIGIVSDMAIEAKKIDEARVEEARQRAVARLRDKISDEEVATVNASLARSLAQLRVKRRRRP
jgi:F-type H+-transporting ATPase subunit epsilon